jgi:hypothetical protein
MTDDERDDMDGAAHAANLLRGVVYRLGRIEVIAALDTLVAALDTAHAHLERLGPHARDPGSVAVIVDLTETEPGALAVPGPVAPGWPAVGPVAMTTAMVGAVLHPGPPASARVAGWPFRRKP